MNKVASSFSFSSRLGLFLNRLHLFHLFMILLSLLSLLLKDKNFLFNLFLNFIFLNIINDSSLLQFMMSALTNLELHFFLQFVLFLSQQLVLGAFFFVIKPGSQLFNLDSFFKINWLVLVVYMFLAFEWLILFELRRNNHLRTYLLGEPEVKLVYFFDGRLDALESQQFFFVGVSCEETTCLFKNEVEKSNQDENKFFFLCLFRKGQVQDSLYSAELSGVSCHL